MESVLHWEPVLGGALAIGHRPKLKLMKNLKDAGATHVFTLLSAKEGAEQIGAAAQKAGLDWIWLPLAGAAPPGQARDEEILTAFQSTRAALASDAKIFLHCSAGIHRTGMMSYALLRILGESPEAAREKLRALRQITGEGVGDHRLEWGDGFAARVAVQGPAGDSAHNEST